VNARGNEVKVEDTGWAFRHTIPGFRPVVSVLRPSRAGTASRITWCSPTAWRRSRCSSSPSRQKSCAEWHECVRCVQYLPAGNR
jgi:hypothetical protein